MSTGSIELLDSEVPNFLTQECKACGTRIFLDAGDVLFGAGWFHRVCWKGQEEARPSRDAELERLLNDGDPTDAGR